MLQKQTQISIARNIKISRFKLSKIISYLAQQKLLSSDLVNFYLKLDYNRISNITFMEIKEYEGETKLIKVIKKTNNLTLNEAYYYFFDSSYQKYLLKKFF